MKQNQNDGSSSGLEEIHLNGIVQPGPLPTKIDPEMNYIGLSSGWKSIMDLTGDEHEQEDPTKVIIVKLGSELLKMRGRDVQS